MQPAYITIAREACLLAPRLANASLHVWSAAPATAIAPLTSAAWVAAQLGLAPDAVARAWIEPMHSGTATRARLRIEYRGSADAAPGPTTMFIKSKPPDFGAALFGVLLDLGGNEVSFYRHLRRDVPVEAPRVYYCDGDSRSYVLLLEDLTDSGCDFRTLTSRCTIEEATTVVRTLAQLHARFWESPRFGGDLAWVPRFETNPNFRLLNLIRQVSVPIAHDKFARVFPERIGRVLPHLLANYQRLEPLWADGPRTLLHGDAHLGNMYFRGGDVGLLDWQVTQLGQGMRDVTYFLINSVGEELRLAHQENLIRFYLATLAELGVTLDFDTAWRQYRLQSVYAWIAGVVTAPSNFQDESVVTAGLARSCKALVDLDAIALLEAL